MDDVLQSLDQRQIGEGFAVGRVEDHLSKLDLAW